MADQSPSKLRVVYFVSQGPELANALIQLFEALGHQIVLVVVTPGTKQRHSDVYKDIVAGLPPEMDVLVTTHMKRLAALLRGLNPDLIYVTGFPWKLPAEVLAIPRYGAINTHPAPLPRYRGPDPIFWQILNGETELGLSVHRMEPDFDTGAILAQATAPIDPDTDADTALEVLVPLGVSLIPRAIAAAIAGEPGTPQNEADYSYAPLRTAEQRILDWRNPTEQLRNQVRAWGEIGAVATLEGSQVVVRKATRVENGAATPAEPGTVVTREGNTLVVQTGDGLLRLGEVTPLEDEAAPSE